MSTTETRADRRARLESAGALEADTTPSEEDVTTRAGFIARSRKAVAAGIGAFAASLGPALVVITADGVVDWGVEVLPVTVVALGLAGGAALAVWVTPNAS